MEQKPLSIFYSYSHKDELLKDELEIHLALLRRKNYVTTWHDRRIVPGSEWQASIDHHIETADIILLLVSPDFIASDYCYGKELTLALERHERKDCVVIPIILRPVDWTEAPFARLQSLPKDGLPITIWGNQDEAWLDVERGIKRAIENIREQKHRDVATKGLTKLGDLIKAELARVETRYSEVDESKRRWAGIPTGIQDLDDLLDGLQGSELVVVAGRPSMGKTDFVANVAAKAALDRGVPVAFFSMQMSAQQIVRRLLCATSRVSSQHLLRGLLGEKDFPRLALGAGKLFDSPLFLDETARLSLSDIAQRARGLKARNGIQLLIIDSLQQVVSTSPSIHDTPGELKALAKELQIPVVVTSNISREVERRRDRRPIVADLGEWGGLEHETDILLFLYRDEIYNYKSPDRGMVEIIVAKNRNGPTGNVHAGYLPDTSLFADLAGFYDEGYEEIEQPITEKK